MTGGTGGTGRPPDGPPTARKIWYKIPGGIPVEEGDKRAATAEMFCFEGDGSKGLPWRPIHELEGYRKPRAAAPDPRPRKGPGDQPRFPSKKP